MNRVLFMAFVVSVVAIALWDILRRNPQLLSGLRAPPKPSPRPGRGASPTPEPPQMGQVIELRRDPFQVLGVDRDISPTELDAHLERLRRENDPSRLEGMSAELRAHAERRLAEVEAAYSQLTTQTDRTDR